MNGNNAVVAHSIRALELLYHEMADISARKEESWKFVMVQKRRELASQMASLAEDLDAWLPELSDGDVAKQIRNSFTELRHVIALTQTQWPLSLIDTPNAPDGYGDALRQLTEKSEAFFASVKRRLA